MLANSQKVSPETGAIDADIHLPGTSIYAILDFIADQLPVWRDRPDRKKATSETSLTAQLCAHLNSAARHSKWDFLQFRTEVSDERKPARKIDLAPSPVGVTVWIDGRRNVDFDILMPIECKRLPTPLGKKRDEREYVFCRDTTTGGIQRFKMGNHGALHNRGGMIAYVQHGTGKYWAAKIKRWISELIMTKQLGWTKHDFLRLENENAKVGLSIFRSAHKRPKLPNIELQHLWIRMN